MLVERLGPVVEHMDFRTRFNELAGEVNFGMAYQLNSARVLVLSLAYKKDIDDLREAPSLTISELLQAQGAEVSYNELRQL